jgi:hypothetical protein
MPRTSYYRKRPGYRAYITSLYSVVRPFMEPAPLDQGVPDVLGLRAEGLSAEQIGTARALLAELGDLIRAGLGVVSLPTAPPDFFALGAEMPSSRFSGSPRLRYHLKPKGRPRKTVARQRWVDQADVDVWMRDRAVFAFSQGERLLKQASIVAECIAAIGASREKLAPHSPGCPWHFDDSEVNTIVGCHIKRPIRMYKACNLYWRQTPAVATDNRAAVGVGHLPDRRRCHSLPSRCQERIPRAPASAV